jgi:glycosyltransferase involved in cell wall biosynthesis
MKPAADRDANNWMTTIALSANGVIAPCRSMRALMPHAWPSRRDVIIPFGVDTEMFKPDPRFEAGPSRSSGFFGSRPFPPARPSNPFRRLFRGPDAIDDDDSDDDEPRPSLFSSSRPSFSGLFGSPPQPPPGANNPFFPRRPIGSDDDPDAMQGPVRPNLGPKKDQPDEPDDSTERDREDAETPVGSSFSALFSAARRDRDEAARDSDDDDEGPDINDLLDANAYLLRAFQRMSEERRLSKPWHVDDDDDDDLDAEEAPEPPPFVGAHPHLLAVGSLIPVKNHALLLRAFARIEARDATLEIVGDGPLLGDLKKLAADLGITDRVTFAGHVPHDKMPDVYRRADLHILTSRHEGFGLVVIEAAACGVPTIGFNVGVLEEMAPAWGTAIEYTIEAESETLLVNRIDDMLTYRVVPLRPLRERVRQLVKERYTLAHMVNGVRSVYVQVLEYGHPVRPQSVYGPPRRPGPPGTRPPGPKLPF